MVDTGICKRVGASDLYEFMNDSWVSLNQSQVQHTMQKYFLRGLE